MRYILFFLVFILVHSGIINAQNDSTVYQLELKREIIIAGASATMIGSSWLFNIGVDDLTAEELPQFSPQDVNAFDRSAIYRYNTKSAQISDYFKSYVFYLPAVALATRKGRKEWKNLGVMYMEVLMVNASMTEMAKNLFQRKRPYVYNEDLVIENRYGSQAKKSFYSGHVSHVSGLSFFTAQVLTDLYPESRYKWAIWTGAAIIPSTCAYLRYDGGRHFPTDVIAGVIAGGLVGALIPALHKRDDPLLDLSIVPSYGGVALSANVSLNRKKHREVEKEMISFKKP